MPVGRVRAVRLISRGAGDVDLSSWGAAQSEFALCPTFLVILCFGIAASRMRL